MYVLAETTHVNLKPLRPWLAVLCWLLWGLGLIAEVGESRWRTVIGSTYGALGMILAWINRRYLFESTKKPSRSLSSVLSLPKATYMAVKDVSATSPWYIEKFGLRKVAQTDETRPDGVTLQFKPETFPFILVPKDPAIFRPAPIFFTRNVEKAREKLMSEGVCVGEVKRDRQDTKFFEFTDNEGNTLEVCERPEGFWSSNFSPSY